MMDELHNFLVPYLRKTIHRWWESETFTPLVGLKAELKPC